MSLDLWLRTGLVYQELLKIIFWIRDVKTDGLFDWIYFAILDQVNLDALRYSGNVQQKSRLTNPNTEPHWKKPAWYQRRQILTFIICETGLYLQDLIVLWRL